MEVVTGVVVVAMAVEAVATAAVAVTATATRGVEEAEGMTEVVIQISVGQHWTLPLQR